MDNESLRSRVMNLAQRSRRAIRLYSAVKHSHPPQDSVSTTHPVHTNRYSEVQARIWRDVNTELLKEISLALENPQQRELGREIVAIREHFLHLWRNHESSIHTKRSEAAAALERSDFIKVALLSDDLVSLKAASQACEAAHHELGEAVRSAQMGQTRNNVSNFIEAASVQSPEEQTQLSPEMLAAEYGANRLSPQERITERQSTLLPPIGRSTRHAPDELGRKGQNIIGIRHRIARKRG